MREVNGHCPAEGQLALCGEQWRVAVKARHKTINVVLREEVALVGRLRPNSELLLGVERSACVQLDARDARDAGQHEQQHVRDSRRSEDSWEGL